MEKNIENFFSNEKQWQEEFIKLRTIFQNCDCGLAEELKWGKPCYTFQGNNIALMHGFKEYCALLFHKGVLLKDPEGILIQQTENVQAARQIRFTDIREIVDMEPVIKNYVREAIEIEKAGLQVKFKKTKEYNVPEEFQKKLDEFPDLEKAFKSLTPGRQRGYLLHFSQPKQSKTRVSRIEKYMPDILEGKGLND